jgi:outer membrane autotransporter protein
VPGTVTVTVTGRPDPSVDAAVRGLVDAQGSTPSRFSRAQITNIQRRMETLHRGPDSAFPPAPPKAPKEPEGAAPGTPPAAGPTSRLNPANPGTAQAAAGSTATGVSASPLVSSLISLAASQSVAIDGSSNLRDGTSVWMGGLAQFGDIEGNGERSGMRFSTDGLSAGADRRINDRLTLGLAAGYARDETRIGNDGSKSKAKGGSFGVYSSYQPTGNTYVDALLGIGKIDFDSTRFVEPFDAFASGKRKADQFFGSVAAGYEWRRDGVLVSPYGRFDFSYDKLKQFTESGADQYNLKFADQTVKSTQLGVGLRAEAQHEMEMGRAVPRVRVEYRRELQGDRNASVSYADLLGGPEYTVTSSGVSRNALLLGVGTDFLFNGGLKVGIDYQAEHASGAKNVQAWRVFVSQDLDFKGLPPFRFNTDMLEKPISVDFGFTHDDNVSRGRLDSEKRSDNITSIGIGQEWIKPLGTNLRLLATPQITAEKFRRFAGLGRFSGGIQGELQYRGSAAFDATTFGLRGLAMWDQYESRLRTGSRFFLGLNARRSITDRIDVFGEVGGNARYGRSDVFEVRDYSVKGNVDYSLGKNGTLYASGEYRRGDTFASGTGSLTNLALSDVFVADDAFESEGFFAYRIEARGVLGTFGYNRPLGPRDSIDISYRRVQITPTNKPSFETGSLRYNDNQYSIVYLIRF